MWSATSACRNCFDLHSRQSSVAAVSANRYLSLAQYWTGHCRANQRDKQHRAPREVSSAISRYRCWPNYPAFDDNSNTPLACVFLSVADHELFDLVAGL